MMKLTYIGPVKKTFGLTLKSGERIRVQPGQPLTVSDENGRHVLRRWSELFREESPPAAEEKPKSAPEAKPAPKAKKATRASDVAASAEKANQE